MLLSIDQGTSSTKACVYAPPGELLGVASVPVVRHVLPDGSVTQDPHALVASCRDASEAALRQAGVPAARLDGVVLANQGESFLLLDPRGRPLTPVFSWQDPTTGDVLERADLRERRMEIEARTGLPLHAEFVAPRLAHRLEQLGGEARGVRLATLDTWLLHELDPARPFVTDRATASRTMLVGLTDQDWDEELLAWFAVPRETLAEIVPCDRPGGQVALGGVELPVLASGYDMGLALLGHGCLAPGEAKATFGTCLGVMAATGTRPVAASGLLTTIAYGRDGRSAFALDGEIAAAGALVEWAISLGMAASLRELDALAASVPDAGGVVLVPAILGLGAPHWRERARATVSGLRAESGRAQLAHALYDAIAWSVHDVAVALRAAGIAVDALRVDGGLTWSRALMQRCADVCELPVLISAQREATAYGGAALAMLARGLITEADVRAAAKDGAEELAPERPPRPEEAAAWAAAIAHVLGVAAD